MHYVISDIHGCCAEFHKLLRKIGFSSGDVLYVLGDTIDRGPDPVGVLRTIEAAPNIIPLQGNHEYMMLKVLPRLLQEVRGDTADEALTAEFLSDVQFFLRYGGDQTEAAFRRLPAQERRRLLDFAAGFSLDQELQLMGKKYLLIHTVPGNVPLEVILTYPPGELLYARPDFQADWSGETICIIGHTPTFRIGPEYAGKIWRKGRLIDIDCGCAYGYALAAYCLETGEVFYVSAENPPEGRIE